MANMKYPKKQRLIKTNDIQCFPWKVQIVQDLLHFLSQEAD